MIRSLIIDDERIGRELLADLVGRYCPNIAVVAQADSVGAAREEIRRHEPELIFLDIEMPRGSGFELLEDLDERRGFEVIFTTAHEQYALRAIKAAAIDYLLKPINYMELVSAVGKAEQRLAVAETRDAVRNLLASLRQPAAEPNKLALPTDDGLVMVPIGDIVRCEASASYTWFHLCDGERRLVSRPLKEFEMMLGGMSFIRVHHSHMVNIDHVRRYIRGEGGELVMSDNSTVLVARRKREDVLRALKAGR